MSSGQMRPRVCVVSHSCVVRANQFVWAKLATDYPVDLTVVAPLAWRTSSGWVIRLDAVDELKDRMVGLPVLTRGHPNAFLWWGLGKTLRRLAPDVIILDEEPYSVAAWQILRARRRLDAALVVYTKQNIAKAHPWPFNVVERLALATVDFIMATDPGAREVITAKGCLAPVSVVPHVVDPQVYSPGPGEPILRRLGLRPPVVGYAGRLVPEKGVMDLLEAVHRLVQDGRADCSVLVVGDGPERKRLEAFAHERLPGRFCFAGQVSHEAVPELYRCMDVLVLPSHDAPHWREQFGRVLIEALACG
ncbi:MAG: glycosyltransferase, partial [Armatimonadetes bacterium]|nr:glycosyltransferase [Armatimonadota bacterium]